MRRDIYELDQKSVRSMIAYIACPAILSLLVQAVYSLVDGIFVSYISETAISAVSLAFVIQNLEVSLFTGIATGINAIISRSLGSGDKQGARNAVLSGLVIQALVSLIFLLFGIFLVRPFFSVSTSDRSVIDYGIRYLRPCMIASVITGMQITHERFLNSVGLTQYVFISQFAGAFVNIVLDRILIFGLGGIPGFGIAGAAYATIIGKAVSLTIEVFFNYAVNKTLFCHSERKLDNKQIKDICIIGIPSSALGIVTSVGNYCLNIIVGGFSITALSAFGIYIKIQTFLTMPSRGIGMALVTIFSFYYGRKCMDKIRETVLNGFLMLIAWGGICAAVLLLFTEQIISVFNTNDEMMEIAITATRIIAITYLPSMGMHCFTSFFEATGKSYLSLAFIFSRQFFARIPFAYILSRSGDVNMIWWSFPISELVSDVVICFVFRHAYKTAEHRIRA